MGLFHQDHVMDWYRKNKIKTFATHKSRQKAESVFHKCCQHSSQDQLLEYVLVDQCWFIPIAVQYMDDAHLIRYACRKPVMTPNGYITDEENRKEKGEVLAIERLRTTEAIAELYLLYQKPGMNRYSNGSYMNTYGQKRSKALYDRIGEKEAALIIRQMHQNGETISPDSWLVERIKNDDLKQELGLNISKEWAIKHYKDFPELKRAQLIRGILDDDEIMAVLRDSRYDYRAEMYLLPTIKNERFLSEHLLRRQPSDVNSNRCDLVRAVLPGIHTPDFLDPLLFTNPLLGFTALYVIRHIDHLQTLLTFREKLISLRGNISIDEKSNHFMNKRPKPSENNLILLVGYNDGLEAIWRELNKKIKRLVPNDTCDMSYLDLYRK